MDRRQRRTRDAIFNAFTTLLTKKNYHQITVGDIIDCADVGRATFYAHFETKDSLLKALCEELFDHIFQPQHSHSHLFDCDAPDSVFLHLFQHFGKNDNHILGLLVCQNNDLFLRDFKRNLKQLLLHHPSLANTSVYAPLPQDFWLNHIASTFIETVRWWMSKQMQQSPEEITAYFLHLIQPREGL